MLRYRKRLARIIAAVALGVAVAVGAVYWNEARKEVVFLCGNFGPGVAEASVRRQLDTGHFLRYRTEDGPAGRRIVADSPLTLGLYRCVVELEADGTVRAARVE
ncbi:hypothetical protein AWN76_009820 [Rhodothermaceae bacterium RA]|nr:hypothetical protein AWN76_009820 [Rhodothermaceae bacterium RA]